MVKLVFYMPGNSWLHRLHPLTKMTFFLCIMVVGFAFFNPLPALAMSFVAVIVAVLVGRQYLSGVLRPLLLILPAIFAMIFFQSFFPVVASPRPFHFLFFTVYYNGLYYGTELASRIVLAIVWGVLVILTTHPGDLFTSLRKVGIPYLFGFMMLTMLQFVPILLAESNTIMEAQQSRGLKISGFRAIIPNFVPLFVGAWERAQVLAMSMEVRAMGSSGVKTSFRRVKMNAVDKVIVSLSVILAALAVYVSYLNRFFNFINTWTAPPTYAGVLALSSLVGFGVAMFAAVASYRA